ncbi:MAG: PASTA domain-containing protein [Clostridia bacterium]|nr:PASTA domain-containing protein [Clostridia bacterium]
MKKRGIAVLVCVLLAICVAGLFYRYQYIEIPDLNAVDISTAQKAVSSKELIPAVEYIYHPTVPEGLVIRTKPQVGEFAERYSKIILYVSKGPERYVAADAEISWYNISDKKDRWTFSMPLVSADVLYIDCTACFAEEVAWKDNYRNGKLSGGVSTTESFKKYIPIEAQYDKRVHDAYEKQRIVFAIPLEELGSTHPDACYIRLYAEGRENIRINFRMTWESI